MVGRLLAQRLGYRFVDTGAMYRAIAWLALQEAVSPDDEETLGSLAASTPVEMQQPTVEDGRPYSVFVRGQDVTWEIRRPEVEALVSLVSRLPRVRRALVEHQRRLAQGGRLVMAGRDIGTVVLPQADLKIYLVASPQERARRRYQELRERGQEANWEEIHAEMLRRDRIDSERAMSPLRPAEDAVVIDTDSLSVEEVLREIEGLMERGR